MFNTNHSNYHTIDESICCISSYTYVHVPLHTLCIQDVPTHGADSSSTSLENRADSVRRHSFNLTLLSLVHRAFSLISNSYSPFLAPQYSASAACISANSMNRAAQSVTASISRAVLLLLVATLYLPLRRDPDLVVHFFPSIPYLQYSTLAVRGFAIRSKIWPAGPRSDALTAGLCDLSLLGAWRPPYTRMSMDARANVFFRDLFRRGSF
jgi:hypothetical protein